MANQIKTKLDKSTQDLSYLIESFNKCKRWINNASGLKFFAPLSLSIRTEFKDVEYMKGRFGGSGMVITNANTVFLGIDFLLNLTMLQTSYLYLNGLLQIAHLHPHRLLKIMEADRFSHMDIQIRQACIGIAGMCYTNYELSNHLANYYTVLEGCDHFMATVSTENYWKFLGWENIEDVPDPIKDIEALLETNVERLAILFLTYHNPDNPPKAPTPAWAQATAGEMGDRSNAAFESQAKSLARRATIAAMEEAKLNKSGGMGFCPFSIDDIHLSESRPISYKDIINTYVEESNSDFGGYDRRNLGMGIDTSYTYSMESDRITCIIYVDISGSLVSSIVDILQEVKNILSVRQDSRVLVKYFADGIQETKDEIWIDGNTPLENWNLPQVTGGTSFAPIREDIEENYPSNNIVIITDGYFFDTDEIMPLKSSGKLLFVMTQNYNDAVDWSSVGMITYSDIPD